MSEKPQGSNSTRAGRARRLVRNYSRTSGYQGEPDYEDDIVDLLTDLRHFCGGCSLDFEELDERANRHYVAERREGVHRCADCGTLWTTDELERTEGSQGSTGPGEIMPGGRCPDCGDLCRPQFSGGVMKIPANEGSDSGGREAKTDLELLKQQAAILGKVVDGGPLTDDERSCLEGLWNFVHSVLDRLEEDPNG